MIMKSDEDLTQIKSEEDKSIHDNEMLKENSHCICLSVILTDHVFKMGKNYYLQVFLKE